MATKTIAQRTPSPHFTLERERAEQVARLLARAEDSALRAFADFTDPDRFSNFNRAEIAYASGVAFGALRDIRLVRSLLAGAS